MNGSKNKHYIILLIITYHVLLSIHINAQQNFRIVFYNVENMFDIKDNPTTNDDDLTPEGNLHWTKWRYGQKLQRISKVISLIGEKHPPTLIGMCEVENDSVLYDLTVRTPLKKDKYRYIISHSNDARGSNVALLYQRDQIKILANKEYTPILDADPPKTTRNILHVYGKVVNGDTLDIFVCHFPSRREGLKKTAPYRETTAKLLRQKTDSLLLVRKKANILIMGDFNDYPNNNSLLNILDAKGINDTPQAKELYNMFYNKLADKNTGTYKYKGKWNYVDQFVVTGNLLNASSKTRIKNTQAFIYSSDYMMEDDIKYEGKKPYRTYSGYKYLGGTSDHLPIYLDLIIK